MEEEFVRFVVTSLVSHPDEVKIERKKDNKGILLELSVASDDLGQVIGRRGNTVQAIRTVLRALSSKNGSRVNLKVIDTDKAVVSADDAQTVEKPTTEIVEKPDESLRKLRDDLADLRDNAL